MGRRRGALRGQQRTSSSSRRFSGPHVEPGPTSGEAPAGRAVVVPVGPGPPSTHEAYRRRVTVETYEGADFYCDIAIPGAGSLAVVYEDARVLAYHHTRPYWPTHIVVVPK